MIVDSLYNCSGIINPSGEMCSSIEGLLLHHSWSVNFEGRFSRTPSSTDPESVKLANRLIQPYHQ